MAREAEEEQRTSRVQNPTTTSTESCGAAAGLRTLAEVLPVLRPPVHAAATWLDNDKAVECGVAAKELAFRRRPTEEGVASGAAAGERAGRENS